MPCLKACAKIYGLCRAIQQLVSDFEPPLVGKVFDGTGSYNAVVLILSVFRGFWQGNSLTTVG
jgi:hypothetical protein